MKTSVLVLMRLALVFGIIAGLPDNRLAAQTSARGVSWSSLNFGSVFLGESTSGTVTLENLTQETIIIESAGGNDRELSYRVLNDPRGLTLRPQGKLIIPNITFAPRSIGFKLADVVVRYRRSGSGLPESDTLRNALVGKGINMKVVVPDTVFGRVGRRTQSSIRLINRDNSSNLTTILSVRTISQNLTNLPTFSPEIIMSPPSVAGGDTLMLQLFFSSQSSGIFQEQLEVITRTGLTLDTVLAPLIGNAQFPAPNTPVLQPFLRITPDSAKPGDTVRLELRLRREQSNFNNVLLTATPQFRAVIAVRNRNLLTLLPRERGARSSNGAGSVRLLHIPLTYWDGRDSLITSLQCLAMIAETDVTSIELVELIWGGAAQGTPPQPWEARVFVESAPAISFVTKTSMAGGKRLFTAAKPISLVQSLAPNPATSASELSYILAENSIVECSLINAHGIAVKQIWSGMQPSGTHTLTIPTDGLASGLYAVRLQTLHGTEHVMLRVFR